MVITLLAICAAGFAWMFLGNQAQQRLVDNANVAGGVAGMAALAATAMALLPDRRTPTASDRTDMLDAATQYLALETLRYWQVQAKIRRITTPSPVTVTWRWASSDVAPPYPEIVRGNSERGSSEILTDGIVSQLREQLYQALPSTGSRIVILGAPGAGKTTAMLLLLIDILKRWAPSSEEPVPVWLSLGGWNTVTTLTDWAAAVIARDYPVLNENSFGGSGTPTELMRTGKIALFLDGFDEMPAELQGPALKQIDTVTSGIRVVLTSRPEEYRAAIKSQRLWDAAVIDVLPVSLEHACEFLLDQQTGKLLEWQRVTDQLRQQPDSVAARTLTSPLALSLARDAFTDAKAEPSNLLDTEAYPSPHRLLQYLLVRFLVDAYPDPVERTHAIRWLTWLAIRLNGRRDIRWWDISTWMAGGRLRMCRTVGLTCGLILGVFSGLLNIAVIGPILGLRLGLLIGFLGAIAAGLASVRLISEGPRPSRPQKFVIRRPKVTQVLVTASGAITLGFVFGVIAGAAGGLTYGLLFGILSTFLAALIFGLAIITTRWTQPAVTERTASPLETYRSERRRLLFYGLAGGISGGLAVGFLGAIVGGLAGGLIGGIAIGFVGGLIIGQVRLGPANLALDLAIFEVLSRFRRAPIKFIPLLETALERQVLRQAGVIYQFRHAALQDVLVRRARIRASRPTRRERETAGSRR